MSEALKLTFSVPLTLIVMGVVLGFIGQHQLGRPLCVFGMLVLGVWTFVANWNRFTRLFFLSLGPSAVAVGVLLFYADLGDRQWPPVTVALCIMSLVTSAVLCGLAIHEAWRSESAGNVRRAARHTKEP